MNGIANPDLEFDLSEMIDSSRIGLAIRVLFAEKARLYTTLSRMVRLAQDGGWISFASINAFLLKCERDFNFRAKWTDDQIEAVRTLQEEFGSEGEACAYVIRFGADQLSWINTDVLALAAGLSCDEPGKVLREYFKHRDELLDAEEEQKFESALQHFGIEIAEVDGLSDLLTVRAGEGYWHVAARLLSAGGDKPSKHDILTLTMKLEAANAQRVISAGGRTLRVGETLVIDQEVMAHSALQESIAKMKTMREEEMAGAVAFPSIQNVPGLF
jgi:hypothetical protein